MGVLFGVLKRYVMNKKIGTKLIICFLSIILMLTITITALGNMLYKSSISKLQNENTNQILMQINSNIENYIKHTEGIIEYISSDLELSQFWQLGSDENIDINDKLYESLYKYQRLNSEIAGIIIVNNEGNYISDVMNPISRNSLKEETWYKKAFNDPDSMHLFNNMIGRNICNIFQYAEDDVFSISKAIIDRKSKEIKGVILIDIKLDAIKNIIESAKPGNAGFIYIINEDKQIVYTPVNDIVYRIDDKWIDDINNKVLIKKINSEKYQLTKAASSYLGWQVIGVFPQKEALKIIKYIIFYSIIIAIIGIVFSGILAIFFSNSIIKPIYKLRSLMKKAQQGELNVEFNAEYNDEIGELGNSFNKMVSEIQKLIKIVKEEEKSKRKAELNVLQAQIKPHFMYNTLDTIRWMAEDNNEKDIVEIIEALTNLLRISLSKGKEVITLGEEIEHIKSYMIIQKIRYEDKLNYEIKCPSEFYSYKVIKLILQPLVENAIYHGIKEKRGPGKIEINILRKEDYLQMEVVDNGRGIEKEKLKRINYLLSVGKSKNNDIGYGIFNVNERIKLNYGNQYGLTFESIEGKGTKAIIKHPII